MEIAALVESSGIFYGLVVDLLNFYMTITFGYLLVAYLAGDKLGTLQATIISFLYLGLALFTCYGVWGWTSRGVHFATLHASADPMSGVLPNKYLAHSITAFLVVGVLASLRFMWDIRHGKTE